MDMAYLEAGNLANPVLETDDDVELASAAPPATSTPSNTALAVPSAGSEHPVDDPANNGALNEQPATPQTDSPTPTTTTPTENKVVFEDSEPSQLPPEEYNEDRQDTEEEVNFWAGRGQDGKASSSKYIRLPIFNRELLSEATIRSRCLEVQAVHTSMQLTVSRILEYRLDNPEWLAAQFGVPGQHSSLRALVTSDGLGEVDLKSPGVHLMEVCDANGQRHSHMVERLSSLGNGGGRYKGYDPSNAWQRIAHLADGGRPFRNLRNYFCHAHCDPNKPHNEVNLYRDLLKQYRKALRDTAEVLTILQGALASLDDPASAWVDMSGNVQKQKEAEVPAEAYQLPQDWYVPQDAPWSSSSEIPASSAQGEANLATFGEAILEDPVAATGNWDSSLTATNPSPPPAGRDPSLADEISTVNKEIEGWQYQLNIGQNVKVATRKLEGLRITLAGLKADFLEENGVEWSEEGDASSRDGQEQGLSSSKGDHQEQGPSSSEEQGEASGQLAAVDSEEDDEGYEEVTVPSDSEEWDEMG